jgi:hypothetical protein
MSASENIWRYELEVPADGPLEVPVPLAPGSHVTVLVARHPVQEDDLVAASSSSTDFWDNPLDDEDWNDA